MSGRPRRKRINLPVRKRCAMCGGKIGPKKRRFCSTKCGIGMRDIEYKRPSSRRTADVEQMERIQSKGHSLSWVHDNWLVITRDW